MIDRLLRISDLLIYTGAVIAALSCLSMAIMLIIEVITTSFFSWSQPWAVEYSTYLLAVTLFLGSGWALRAGGHIRVNALFNLLPPSIVRFLDLLGTTFACGITGFAAAALIEQALRTWHIGSVSYFPSETPLVYPQALLALAFVLITLSFISRLIRLLRRLPTELVSASLLDTEGK